MLSCIAGLVLCFGAAQARYVRKQVVPDFFIPPKDAFNQPEKLPPLPKIQPVEQEEDLVRPAESEMKSDMPEYQRKFAVYNYQMQQMSRNKILPENPDLDKDLAQMNSNELFEVPREPYQDSEVTRAFGKILEQSLENY